jgi:penicillin-binding protein 1A
LKRVDARRPFTAGAEVCGKMRRAFGWLAVAAVQAAALLWVVAFFLFGPGFVRAPTAAQIRELVSHGQIRVATAADGTLAGQCLLPSFVPLDEISPHVLNAAVATEDARFFGHVGIDPRGIARSLIANLLGRGRQGGSTITQQLVKNLLFDEAENPLSRKLLEIPIAIRFEMALSKQEILSAYLNQAYFAGGVIGIEAAARHFYAKRARDLNAYEAAVLVGILKSPRDYSPRNPDAALARAKVVLARQIAAGLMTVKEVERALRVGARPGTEPLYEVSCQYFRDWVLRTARDELGQSGRFRLVVTLDAWRQAEMVYAADRARQAGQARNAGEVAGIDMTPRGAVRAMLGGADYAESQFNRVVQARRSPGSLAKLALYAEACRQGFRPQSELLDAPLAHGWPTNHDGAYWGKISLAESMTWSRNGSAARLEEALGVDKVVATARRLGLSGPLPAGRGFSLGAFGASLLDLTGAYAAVANGGVGVSPHGILGVVGAYGEVAWWRRRTPPERVLSQPCAAMMRTLLRGVVRDGTGRGANFDRTVHGKTGTSNDYRDAWFVGFFGDTVAGIWIGNDGPAPMVRVGGASLPAAAFRTYGEGVTALNGGARPVGKVAVR